MNTRVFGEVDGRLVYEVTLRSETGAEAKIIEWGAILRDLVVPTGQGGTQRVVLGLNTLEDYIQHSPYFGAIAGRYGNRIAQGRFRLGDRTHHLSLNDGRNSLHGGARGFSSRPWQLAGADASSVAFTLLSRDDDQGYPGNLTVSCLYRLVGSTLRVELTAATDADTPVNLCQHSYFNLDGSSSILDHTLQLDADFYTPTDTELIPTGEVRAVAGTPYDFSAARPVRWIDQAAGRPFRYDINFVLRRDRLAPSGMEGCTLAYAGTFASARSGVAMEVWSTEPGLQFYDGWMTDVPVPGIHGGTYGAYAGVCLEPQYFPDSPNRPHFPAAILRPDAAYRQITEYRFAATDQG
jgi:aldose 1-epimerase